MVHSAGCVRLTVAYGTHQHLSLLRFLFFMGVPVVYGVSTNLSFLELYGSRGAGAGQSCLQLRAIALIYSVRLKALSMVLLMVPYEAPLAWKMSPRKICQPLTSVSRRSGSQRLVSGFFFLSFWTPGGGGGLPHGGGVPPWMGGWVDPPGFKQTPGRCVLYCVA